RAWGATAAWVLAAVAAVAAIGAVGGAALRAAPPTQVVHSDRYGLPARVDESWGFRLIAAWLLLSSLLAVALSAAGEPVELQRVVILVIPALALALAWTWTHPLLPTALGGAVLGGLVALALVQAGAAYGVSPENWQAAEAYVSGHTSRSRPACVVFYPQDGRESFDYYLLQSHPRSANPAPDLRPVLPSLPWVRVKPFVERYGTVDAGQRAGIARQCPRLWLLASHVGQRHGPAQSRANLARYVRLEALLAGAYRHVSQRVFGWSAPITVTRFWQRKS
ncbi:MAG: hypothetical protein ACP5H2_11640, partial [Solirubrobacteraceae bacterium]